MLFLTYVFTYTEKNLSFEKEEVQMCIFLTLQIFT